MIQLYFRTAFFAIFILSLTLLKSHAQTITTSAITGSPFCTYTGVTVSVPYTKTGTFTAGNQFRAQLSDPFGSFASPVTIGSITSVNNGTITATIPAGTISGTGYRIRVVSTTPVIIGTNNGTNLTMNLPAGDPSVFGNGSWNVYAYRGASFATYYGSYTENNFNFSSATRWGAATSPSSADASTGISYSGCAIANSTTHAVSYKATNFGCGQYQVDIPNNDDTGYLLINGVQVWTRPYSNALATNVWTGFLDPTTTVEFSWVNTGGNSNGALNMSTSVAGPVALAPTAGVDCASFTANWNNNFNGSAYFIDVATDAAFTAILPAYNNLNVGNVGSALITGLTPGTQYYYRVRAFSAACSLTSGNSNVVSNQVALVSAATFTLCQGESATLIASNATNYSWSPATGLNTTAGTTVIATPTASTVYTVTGTDALGCASYGTFTVNVNIPSGDPTVFGNGAWNAYGYNGVNKNNYYGFYTENNLSFNSTTRWGTNSTPSSANAASGIAYTGCPNLPVDQHSVSYKRTNIVCEAYRIDVVNHDDGATLVIDGVTKWNNNGCCAARPDIWRGFLDPTKNVEFWWRDTGGGGSYGQVNLLTAAVPDALPPTAGVSCSEFVANWSTFEFSTNYFLDVSTDSLFSSFVPGYNNLNVGNVTTYLVTGLPIGPFYYYRLRAFSSVCGLLTGNSNIRSTQVVVTSANASICEGTSTTLTASNATTYSWSPATGLSATTGAVVTASPVATTVYTVTGTTAGGCVSSNTFTVTVTDSIGNPSVFGNGQWNVYGYAGDIYNGNPANNYYGMYTENNLSFNSTTRWGTNNSPSNANAVSGLTYAGCIIPNDGHSVSYKRTNFICGTYVIDVPLHDDDAELFVNGVRVWFHSGCCDAHTNVWTGFLSPASTVEFRWREGTGGSNGGLTITNTQIVVSVAATPGPTSCTEFNANWNAASSATKYYLDVSTSSIFASFVPGFNNLDVGNVITYLVTGLALNTQYYYRIRAENPTCGITGNSNTVSYTTLNVTAQPGAFTTSSAAVCQGQNNVAYTVAAVTGATSYTWTYSGTGATFTNGTTRNPTVSFSTTATSGTISVVANNLCGTSAARTMAVTVNPLPAQPTSFTTSSASVCQGQSGVAYTIPAVAGATSYAWSYSGTGATFTGGTTVNPTVAFSASATSGTMSVAAVNACGTGVALTMAVTVNSLPAQPGAYTTSTANVCRPATNVAYSVPAVGGATSYTWTYSGAGATITGGTTNSVTINFSAAATSGNLSVRAVNAAGCTGPAQTMAITISTGVPGQPGAFSAGATTVCQGSTGNTYTVGSGTGAVSYVWSYATGSGATITGTTTSATIDYSVSATSGTVTVFSSNACGLSASSRTRAVTVNPLAVQPSVITPSTATPCNTSTGITYTVTNVGGTTYAWSYSGTGAAITSGSTSNSITVSYTAATSGTWTVTPSNGCGTGPNRTLAVSVQPLGTWSGITSTAWATTTNWGCGTVPLSTTDVIIPSGVANMPTISAVANVKSLTINASATLTNSATGTLNVYGNVSNSGTYSDKGTTAFIGSTAQTYTGTATDSLNNLTLNNAAGLTINTATYVKRYLTLTTGTLASGGNLTVDIYFGAILGTGTGSVSGNMTVVRTLWKDNWHYISSPLSGRTVNDWNDDVLIKFGANANLYTYDETNVSPIKDVGWTVVPNAAVALTSMKGYALYITRYQYKTDIDMTGTYNHAATYSATLTNTASGTALSDGWNLVGNPYPSEIDWDAASGWTKTGLDNAIYFWDQPNNRYASYVAGIGVNGGTRYIPCMQGFYVVVTNPGTGTLAMNNNVRSSVSNRDNWRVSSQEDPMIRLKVDNGLANDEAVIRLSDEATDSFDSQLDAHKLPSGGTTPSLSTKSLNIDYTVNSIPMSTLQKTIPVKVVAGLTGAYTISADITGFDDLDTIILEDKLLGVTQDLKLNSTYTATLTKADTVSRFYINYKKTLKATGVTDANAMAGISIAGQEQTVTVLFSAENSIADIAIYDVTGNLVYKVENKDVSSGKATIFLPQVMSGIYIVKAQTVSTSMAQQVFLSK